MVKITPREFKVLADYILSLSGIALDASKTYLIETRLAPLMKETGLASFSELYYRARADRSGAFQRRIVDAVTTNETFFFRDKAPFELLRHKILPDLVDARRARSSGRLPVSLRIWSAACSTGQEVYSIAIVVRELLQSPSGFNVSILGTDISNEAVKKASYGHYNRFEVERGFPKEKLSRYFTARGSEWKVNDRIRAMVRFKKHNLMEPLAGLGRFDIVFCRNVAIYFKLEDRKKLFNRIAQVLDPPGYLLIGASELLSGVCDLFEPKRYLRSVFYQLKEGQAKKTAPAGAKARPPLRPSVAGAGEGSSPFKRSG